MSLHVDDFIWNRFQCDNYARFVLMLFRLPAVNKVDFREYTEPFKLFCSWHGKRWRVTGASRLGDIWLASDFTRDAGYDHRVDVEECSDWSREPS